MKKALLFFAVVGLLSATSCKKDYTCTCSNGVSSPLGKVKKSDAQTACDSYEALQNLGGGSVSCDI